MPKQSHVLYDNSDQKKIAAPPKKRTAARNDISICKLNAKADGIVWCPPLLRFTNYFLLALQLVLEDHGHDDAHDTDDQSAKEGVPPDGVIDLQADSK